MRKVEVRFDEEQLAQIDAECARHQCTRQAFIRNQVSRKRMEPEAFQRLCADVHKKYGGMVPRRLVDALVAYVVSRVLGPR